MGDKTGIEWTDATWNPVTGCDKISQGCKNCYAEVMAKRLQAMGQANYRNGFAVTLQPHMLELPLRWRRRRRIFVNSMSDLFHDQVPLDYIKQVFDVMARAEWHTFQVLTKRAQRLAELAPYLPWTPNIWMGVSVEDYRVLDRVGHLLRVPAAVRFLSCEPLIGPLTNILTDDGLARLDLEGIHWVIAGGESGPRARPMQPDWVRTLRDECVAQRVPFFFKQWGEFAPRLVAANPGRDSSTKEIVTRVGKRAGGRELDGRTWDEFPLELAVAQ